MQPLAIFFLIFSTVLFSSSASAQTEAELATIMADKLDSILAAVEPQNGETEAIAAMADDIDFASITRGVLGKHRDAVSDDQRARFRGEFERSMLQLLRTALQSVGVYQAEVTGTRLSEKNPARAQVFATVTTEDKKTVQLVCSVANVDDDWLVRNLILEGLNLGLTYRSQFDELMQANAGDIDKAIDAWAEKVVQNADI